MSSDALADVNTDFCVGQYGRTPNPEWLNIDARANPNCTEVIAFRIDQRHGVAATGRLDDREEPAMTISIELQRSKWFGPVSSATAADRAAALRAARTPDEYLLAALDSFRVGDLDPKSILIDLLNTVRHQPFTDFAVRVFASVATHDDLADLETMAFLTNAAPSTVVTFAHSSTSMMSIEAVALMLGLLEDWNEDPEISEALLQAIASLVPFQAELGDSPSPDELAEHVGRAIQSTDRTAYVLYGQPAHPSLLARRLVEHASIAAASREQLGIIVPGSLLSIWSGVDCPVDYDTQMNGDRLDAVHAYVDALSRQDWVRGAKYFYGHRL